MIFRRHNHRLVPAARLDHILVVYAMAALSMAFAREQPVFPAATWEHAAPESLALEKGSLDQLRDLVGGRGCVARRGKMVYEWGDVTRSSDIASAMKPVISTLLLIAVQEGRIRDVDEPVVRFEPRLRTINGGKDAGITWRHLASQTSGYGLEEPPGGAYAYNDFALTLYHDLLSLRVFGTNSTAVLRQRLAEPLQFEDRYTFNAIPAKDHGRLALSVRDFARFGLLILNEGQWRDRSIVKPELVRMFLSSPVPANTPLTANRDAEMLPNQRSIGGGKNITPIGPGFYSFNWWLNGTDRQGRRLLVDAPTDTILASGHGGKRVLWIIPSLELLVCWNESVIEDHDTSPGNADTKMNRAARLIRAAAGRLP